eukprot:3938034-Rhodomonas_salina.1
MEKWAVRAAGFDVDAYADPDGGNAVCSHFRSSVSDPEEFRTKGKKVWAFPPVDLVDELWGAAEAWEAKAVMAFVPSCRVPDQGWTIIHSYPAGSRLFQRPVGERVVRCKGSGLAWSVVVKEGSEFDSK